MPNVLLPHFFNMDLLWLWLVIIANVNLPYLTKVSRIVGLVWVFFVKDEMCYMFL